MPRAVLLVAFLGDYAFFLGRTAMIFYAIRLGAGTPAVLLLGAAEGAVYALTAGRVSGALVAAWGARQLIRLAGGALALVFLAAPLCDGVGGLLALFALGGVPLALFWPAVHARLIAGTPPALVPRVQAVFNVVWSLAVLAAFASSGWLFEQGYDRGFGPGLVLGVAASVACGVALIPLGSARGPGAEAKGAGPGFGAAATGARLSPPGLRLFALAGWLGNFSSFVVYDAVRFVFPSLGWEMGFSESRIGVLTATTLLAATATFVLTTLWNGWVYRLGWFYCICALHLGALATFTFAYHEAAFIGGFALVGAALALSYATSLFYGLGVSSTAGHSGGRHESMIGAARILGPLLGAGAAYLGHSSRAPFVVYGIGIVLVLIVYMRVFSKLTPADHAQLQLADDSNPAT